MRWMLPWIVGVGIVWLIAKTIIMFRKSEDKEPK